MESLPGAQDQLTRDDNTLSVGEPGSLNAIKRELALFAGAFVIAARGCGELWTVPDVARRLNEGFAAAITNLGT